MGTRATRREQRSCVRRHARREARVVWICSGGAAGGRVAEAMTGGGGEVSGGVEGMGGGRGRGRGKRKEEGGAGTDKTP